MNSDTVIIEDDDIEMVPIVVLDEDDDNVGTEKAVEPQTVETIDLDDDQPQAAPMAASETVPMDYATEKAFVRKLKINSLMDKIVQTCLNMKNAVGMPRVIQKTLIPLYKDTSNAVKQSKEFKKLLRKTWKLLKKDPNHKFLHIKTLCEELKSGRLRRKVPFVTLTRELPHRTSGFVTELNSSSKPMNSEESSKQTNGDEEVQCLDMDEIGERRSERIKEQEKCGAANRKLTAYSQAVKSYQHRKRFAKKLNDIHLVNAAKLNKQNKQCVTAMSKKLNGAKTDKPHSLDIRYEKTDIIILDNSDNELEDSQTSNENQNVNIILDDSCKENTLSNEAMNSVTADTEKNVGLNEDSNKENDQSENNITRPSNEDIDVELLIPKNHIDVRIDNVDPYNYNEERIKAIEKDIAFYKKRIEELEEAEVITDNGFSSPYIQCAKFKSKIVECYKKICELNGDSDIIVKRREIRLQVANGHPSGPAKRLEEHLNDSIDNTGAVAFPDFSDVVKCVIEANREERLGWNKQEVIREASALFRQCGQALRKRRQKREYRDLLCLVPDKQDPDDPAENNPELLAKLEENKLIAKIKEEEILERYVKMENQMYSSGAESNREASTMEFESDRESSNSESDSEDGTIPPEDVAPDISHDQFEIEGRRSEIEQRTKTVSFECLVSNNNLILTPNAISNQANTAGVSNNHNVSVNANPSSCNPLLSQLLDTPFVSPSCALSETTGNQNITRESSSVKENQAKVPIVVLERHQVKHINTEEIIDNNNLDTVTTTNNANIINRIKIEDPDDPNIESSDINENHNCSNSNYTSISDRIQFCDQERKEEDVKVKKEPEPVDVQSMLDELGDGFVCTVFDFEDPFLVIEISSDEFSEDET
ncbi:uncharacterized protein LOC110382081 [Helicoverpa armigera]|uniref:uncharacterized protein LOC110382081 n=1 Tax=Helicoverpa armigera TaxID=29058 RepID=UPI003083C353